MVLTKMTIEIGSHANTKKVKKVKGFASMPKDKVIEIAKLGGKTRAQQLGKTGYAVLGRKGGRVRVTQMSHQKYVLMGRRGGLQRNKKI
ncbi:MAG: hypothetical protein LBD36_00045 [Holosporales bacterium]|jgi:general stress protein YciG|nr:hypothetical protein [Holosporales bacterium]